MDRPRIAFVDVPRMILDILQNELRAADMPVVGTYPRGVLLAAAAEASDANVIVTSAADAAPPVVERFLRGHPGARVFVLESAGSETFLCELRPTRIALGELSASALVRTILGEAAPLA